GTLMGGRGNKGLCTALIATLALPLLGAAKSSIPPPNEVNVTRDPTYRWGESAVAVNPRDPNNIVIATVGVGFTNACQKSPDCATVPVDFGIGRPFPQPRGMFSNPDFNRVYAFVTFDRGRTWKRHDVPVSPRSHPDLTGTGDPHVTAAPDGT